MTGTPTLPPDRVQWGLSAEQTASGVDVVVDLDIDGRPLGVRIHLSRDDAKRYAHTLLAAAGDGAERTSPHARILEAARRP